MIHRGEEMLGRVGVLGRRCSRAHWVLALRLRCWPDTRGAPVSMLGFHLSKCAVWGEAA